jgi:HAD superfamily hydrolase (TIGR01509 family)
MKRIMKNGGVIFDFNGTLFWDSEFQETAWDKYLESHNRNLTLAQKKEYIHGRNNKDTLEFIFKRELNDLEIEQYSEEKEIIYRNECLKNKMQLAPGAVELLSYLNAHSIPIAIATASGKSNVDFFINKLNLLDYFAEEHIIYNDGNIKGKPHPDIFEKAIDKLGVNSYDSIIFEDSFSGIQAAMNCKVANIIIVNSTKENYSEFKFPIIGHFDEFDRNLLSCSCMGKSKY